MFWRCSGSCDTDLGMSLCCEGKKVDEKRKRPKKEGNSGRWKPHGGFQG